MPNARVAALISDVPGGAFVGQPLYQRIPGALGSDLGDETVLLNFDNGVYYSVKGVGTLLWRLLESPHTVGELVAAVRAQHEVEESRVRADVEAFLHDMESEGLVKRIAAP